MKTDVARVRPAQPEDAGALRRVHAEAWQHTYEGILPYKDLQRHIHRHNMSYWARMAAIGGQLYALEYEKRVVGYMMLGRCASSVCHRLGKKGRVGEVYSFYLLPLYQGLGFGTRMLSFAASRFALRNCESFVIRALVDNHGARGFYENRGGEEVLRGAEVFSGQSFETITYYWPLNTS